MGCTWCILSSFSFLFYLFLTCVYQINFLVYDEFMFGADEISVGLWWLLLVVSSRAMLNELVNDLKVETSKVKFLKYLASGITGVW